MSINLNLSFDNIDQLTSFVQRWNTATRADDNAAEPVSAPQGDTSTRQQYCRFNLPIVGESVHWRGTRFEFDGVVVDVDEDAIDDTDKVVWVRRNDTGKRVSLTVEDINVHGDLTALVEPQA